TVDDPLVAVELGSGARTGQVAPTAGLAEPLAPHLLTGEQWLQISLLLLVGAPGDDRRTRHAETDHANVVGSADARGLLQVDPLVGVRRAAPAVLLGPGQPDVAAVVELACPLAGERLVPAADRRW